MRTSKVIHVVNCHAAGEVGDVIVGGVAPPPGKTLWEQRAYVAEDGALRDLVLNEPRGGLHRHVNLLVPPVDPRADMGWIIMEPVHTPPMSGSNAICVTTVLLETGILPMQEPITQLVLEAPGGLVEVTATCRRGKVTDVKVQNVASFAERLDAPLEVEGFGTLSVDVAYGGDSFVIVDATALGFRLDPSEGAALVAAGQTITKAANEQLGFCHPQMPDWNHVSFCQIALPLEREGEDWVGKNAVVIEPGKIDRSPTGTGVSARLAVLHARQQLSVGEGFIGRSILDSEFRGEIVRTTDIGRTPGIIPSIAGQAWIHGTSQLMLDPSDPWPRGYRVGDTWPIGEPSVRG